MNSSIIRYILGHVLKIEGILMLSPCAVALLYGETAGFYYLGVAVLCFVLGLLMTLRRPASQVFYMKEGCAATALSWIFLSVFGCLPFWLSREIPSFTDALFETVSGFTTTGASILSDVEALSHCALFWRSSIVFLVLEKSVVKSDFLNAAFGKHTVVRCVDKLIFY